MRRPLTALAILASATAAAPSPAAPQTLAITDVNVVDVGEGVIRPGMTVVVSGERIMALGPSGSVEVPGDARVVDGTGRFLIPGRWDMHVHTGSDENTRGIMYPLLMAHGVTGMRNMMGDCFDCGPVYFAIDQVHARRRAVAAGELLGPRVVASSAFAGSHEQAARRSSEGSSPRAPATKADARAFVRVAQSRGADFIKVYDMLSREAYFALAEEADRLGLPIAGHVPVAVRASADAIRAATLSPAQFLESTDSLGTVEAGKLADLVLLDANPLADISNTQQIAGVVLRGRYMDREALDALLAEAERAAQSRDPTGLSDTVYVSAPTGVRDTDRASIVAALERARPGNIVQFRPGTYLVGELIPIETPQLTMLGHANGTTLRGCEPDSFEQLERDRQVAREDLQERLLVMRRCGVFEMTGGHGTIRGLTFEHTWMGLALGAASSIEDRMTEGGYLVEDNVFRDSGNGVRPGYLSSAPTVIRGNRFMNVFHAVSGAGAGIHVVNNDISVPEAPIALPDGPGFAIGLDGAEGCVIEGNRIEGHRDGIVLFGVPGRPTRRNVIRDNTITGTVFPVGLWGDQEDANPIQIEDNLIEGNRIMGGVVGIALNRASGNRILDNTISGISVQDPSLGEANGAGVWLSPGSDENRILGNMFEDIATYPIVLEGDSNRVGLRSVSDEVRDLGRGNQVGTDGTGAAQTGASTTVQARMIEVDGYAVRVATAGLETRHPDQPVVVFESGGLSHLEAWSEGLPAVASFAPVLAYDRSGIGESEWDGAMRIRISCFTQSGPSLGGGRSRGMKRRTMSATIARFKPRVLPRNPHAPQLSSVQGCCPVSRRRCVIGHVLDGDTARTATEQHNG